MSCIRFLSNNNDIDFDDKVIYITFSRVFHSQNINQRNVLYFFDIDPVYRVYANSEKVKEKKLITIQKTLDKVILTTK